MSQPQMAMPAMGGPVGGMNPNAINIGTPNSSAVGLTGTDYIKRLNTAIYDYMLRNQLYDIARQFYQKMEIETDTKKSPNQRGQVNGLDDGTDTDNKEIQNRPDDLPAPMQLGDGPFLQDWWCQFWEIFHGHRGKGKPATLNYINIQRNQQKQRAAMMGNGTAVDAAAIQRMSAIQNMNGNNVNMDLKRAALQNPRNMNPQAMAQYQKLQASQQNAMMAGAQMERQNSQIDMTGARTGSPGSGDGPSPKRQRIEGAMQANNPARPQGPTQNNQSMENYSHSIQQHVKAAMTKGSNTLNKGLPQNNTMGQLGPQTSPMTQPNLEGGVTGEFYAAANGANRMNAMANVAAANQQNVGNANSQGNHALQDYQMQLMLLEQQNKKRLLMARQEQDNMTHPAVAMPNGHFQAVMSPSGSRQGDPSPNPNEMQRIPSKMNKAGMSPNGDMAGRGSPQPGAMITGNVPNDLRQQMMQTGQGMRPPSSHPQMPTAAGPDQMRMLHQQQQQQQQQHQNQMLQNGWQGGPPHPNQMMLGQPNNLGGPLAGQPNAGPPNMTPRQATQMGPPPAPATGTQPSSPSQTAQAPPTPNQNSKAKNNRKETKAKPKQSKAANAAAPPQEAEQPPTPTAPTAITGMNNQAFNSKPNQHLANGQSNGAQGMNNMVQQNANNIPPQNQAPDMNNVGYTNIVEDYSNMGGMNLEFANIDSTDVLDNFDFDSFLNTNDTDGGFGFDGGLGFDGSIEAGGDLTNGI